jgi:hypothetical protein
MRSALSIIVVSVAVIGGGCSKPSPSGVSGGTGKPVAGYDFEVRGAAGSFTRGQAETFSVQSGASSAEVKDRKLTVNGKAYGTVADGATILVEENGKVLVNGKERLPE